MMIIIKMIVMTRNKIKEICLESITILLFHFNTSNEYDLNKENFKDEEIDEDLAFGEDDEDLIKMFEGKKFSNNNQDDDLPDTLSDNDDTMELSAMLDEPQSDEEPKLNKKNNKKVSLLPESEYF